MEEQEVNIIIITKYLFFKIANPEEIRANMARKYFQDRLPELLRDKSAQPAVNKPGQPAKDEKKEAKEENKEQAAADSKDAKKDEGYDLGTSEMDQGEEEHKTINKELQERLERELQQTIYISISETPTQILFYCPSTKYLTLKNSKESKIIIVCNILSYF